jgi:pullulanase/glycogen debranching enzyme
MEKTTNVGGTFLQGYIKASYDQLVKTFGEPHDPNGDNYKTDVEWAFEFADGTVATLYNWKNGKNYLGEAEGLELNDIYEWHVGGFSDKAVAKLLEKLRA